MTLVPTFFPQPAGPDEVPAALLSRRLEESIESAGYWVQRMPREAARLACRIRLFSVAAAVLALLAAVLAWPVVANTAQLTAQALVSALAALAALTFAVPHLLGMTDRSDASIRLCASYTTMYRELLDAQRRLTAGSVTDPTEVTDMIALFERIHRRKDDALVPGSPDSCRQELSARQQLLAQREVLAQQDFSAGGRSTRSGSPAVGRDGCGRPLASLPPQTRHAVAAPGTGLDAEAVLAALLRVLTHPAGNGSRYCSPGEGPGTVPATATDGAHRITA